MSPCFITDVFKYVRMIQFMKEFEGAHQIVSLIVAEKRRPLSEEEQSVLSEWISAEESKKRSGISIDIVFFIQKV